jgi:hypothetical protein
MSTMRLLLFFFIFGNGAKGAVAVYTDLSAKPFANVTRWTHKEFYGDHSNRQPTQPPGEWSNFTYLLYPNTTGVQLTSRYSMPSTASKRLEEGIPVPERVVHWELQGYVLEVGVVWWGKSWRLYLGCI